MNDNTSAVVESAIREGLTGIRDSGPEPLLELVQFKLRRAGVELTEEALLAVFIGREKTDSTWRAMHMALAQWDATSRADWSNDTDAWSANRRELIYEKLELSTDARERLDTEFPSASKMDTMIVDPEHWDPCLLYTSPSPR